MVFPDDWACTKNGKTKQKRAERRRIILGRFIDRWRIKYKIEQPPEKRETFMDFFQWLGRIAFARTAFDGGWCCGIFFGNMIPRSTAIHRGVYLIYRGEIWFFVLNIENRHEIWFREIWFITMHFNPLGTNKMMWGKWHMPVCRWAYLCIIL